jgi:hypothetical protein
VTAREYNQSSQIIDWLDGVVEACEPVADLTPPTTAETPADLHQRLLVTRAAMTRVSELAGEMTLLNGRVRATTIERKGAVDDAEAKVMTTPTSHRRVLVTEDYSSGKERNARLGAATVMERTALRRVERLAAEVEAALSYTRDRHRELDRAVRDIDTRMRLLTFEGSTS